MKSDYGILLEFIKAKREGYTEPRFMGPGPEGLSRKKFLVSLFTALSDWSLSRIANRAKVSYGVIKVWKTQKAFQKAEEEHIQEFIDLFYKRALEFHKSLNENILKDLTAGFRRTNDNVRLNILDCIKNSKDKIADPESQFMMVTFGKHLAESWLIIAAKGTNKQKKRAEMFRAMLRDDVANFIQGSIRMIADTLDKEPLEKIDIKEIVATLGVLADSMEDLKSEVAKKDKNK